MSVEQALRDGAEQAAYVRAVSKRIGELAASQFDPNQLVDATDDELRAMAATLLAILLNELGEEALQSAVDVNEAAGFDVPEEAQTRAIDEATTTVASRLFVALEEQRARAQKAASGGVALSEGFALGMAGVLARIFGEAAQALGSDIPNELNRALAFGHFALGDTSPADGISGVAPMLTWITLADDSVCHDDEGGGATTLSGIDLPPGAATSCEARHGITLPAEDWIAEGLPRDPRLLCSSFGIPQCRCVVVPSAVDVPEEPVNVGPDIARGKQRGADEPLSLDPVLVDKTFKGVAGKLEPLADPNLFELKIRVSKRAPAPVAPAPAPVPVKAKR